MKIKLECDNHQTMDTIIETLERNGVKIKNKDFIIQCSNSEHYNDRVYKLEFEVPKSMIVNDKKH